MKMFTLQTIAVIKYFAKVKYYNTELFDKTTKSFNGAEICYLVCVYFLNRLTYHKPTHQVALYRHNGLTFDEITLVYYLR